MTTVRSSTFTGSDGATWTLDSGSWTHTTESGSFSAGPTENIQTNKGRANGTASAVAVRRHHAGTGTFEDIEVTVNVVRSYLTCKPGIILRATGNGASDSFYLVQAETVTGKSTTYGLAIYKRSGSTYTQLLSYSTITGFSTTGYTLYLAARIQTLDNGNCRIQAKGWATGSSEPSWVSPAGDTAGMTNSSPGTIAYIDNTTTLKDTAGQVGLYTEIDTASATYQADYDNFIVTDSWAQDISTPVLQAPATLLSPRVDMTLGAPLLAAPATPLEPTISTESVSLPSYVGAAQVTTVYVGTSEATKLYIGSTQIWP